VNRAGTILWFAHHEGRLAWRDWLWLMSTRHRSVRRAVLGAIAIGLFLHAFAFLVLHRYPDLSRPPDQRMLIVLTGILALYGSLMVSQAMERVTRAFYGRADLDLILSSPVVAWRLFAVRIGAIAVTIAAMSLALAAPFINVLTWFGGLRWLAAYGVIAALAMVGLALALILTVGLFHTIGPIRTRLCAQIVAAAIGASFAIGVQFAAILSYGTPSRVVLLQSEALTRYAPDIESFFWWPARAILGDLPALAVVFCIGSVVLTATISIFAPLFGQLALASGSISPNVIRRRRRSCRFRQTSPTRALRRKEWILLLRDPWLVSQTLMQLLYLLPPAFLLWRSFYNGNGSSALLVPVLIIAAGQLAGSLAWLAISGEDAADLIASAPVTTACAVRAKTEAVMGVIAIVFGPFLVALLFSGPISAFIATLGVASAAASATSIQFWFRARAKRSQLRRRHTSSLVATFAEALSSFSWAGAAALAPASTWLAVIEGVFALAIVGGAWVISPAKNSTRSSCAPGKTTPDASRTIRIGDKGLLVRSKT
jgi:ABC-2 type transport system permease protein